jgi:hypothetical protein
MEVVGGSARFSASHGKFEVFCCRWEDFGSFMKELLETEDTGEEPTTVKFDLISSDLPFEEWCEENEVVLE